ncbi:hypothetical protein K466DRAFT_581750 [Polyporus arcularius HHB13444]|uniref:Uncharacterized protein n=1 Tax=Polyporus arcularius HHB13444 TaxID=1314778 RepID=A0A5C3PT84_9APHY|nr:hypothetical protein K466DRAFT_581750 [Polyporus arcularius HHB13444]
MPKPAAAAHTLLPTYARTPRSPTSVWSPLAAGRISSRHTRLRQHVPVWRYFTYSVTVAGVRAEATGELHHCAGLIVVDETRVLLTV